MVSFVSDGGSYPTKVLETTKGRLKATGTELEHRSESSVEVEAIF